MCNIRSFKIHLIHFFNQCPMAQWAEGIYMLNKSYIQQSHNINKT